MRQSRDFNIVRRRESREAFTLIELLVVLALISLLIAMILPSLRAAREESRVAKCLANLRSICTGTQMYMDAQGRQLLTWYQYPPQQAYANQIGIYTPLVFGGFRAPRPSVEGANYDAALYPAQLRPLNSIMAPAATAGMDPADRGRDVIEVYKCPSDRTFSTSIIGTDVTDVEEEALACWQTSGSSFCLNTRFMQGYAGGNGDFTVEDSIPYGLRLTESGTFVGGKASRFVLWLEQGMYSAAYRATPTLPNGAAPQRMGWHRRFSQWSAAFADGHAAYGYFDTRTIYGLDGTLWQP